MATKKKGDNPSRGRAAQSGKASGTTPNKRKADPTKKRSAGKTAILTEGTQSGRSTKGGSERPKSLSKNLREINRLLQQEIRLKEKIKAAKAKEKNGK